MFYFILIFIILYLLYKEYRYGKEVNSLVHAYLNIIKISYIHNKKQTISNINVYEEMISNELPADEYDHVFKTLTKSWDISYVKSPVGSFADGKRILNELANKIEYITKEPNYDEIVRNAKLNLKK